MRLDRRILLAGAASIAITPGAFAQQTDAFTAGGQGGRIVRVTTLKPDGPGSIAEAIRTKGSRIIVFEVGGVIDLGMKTLRIDEPNLTIAGQTAPAPGVTFIRGGISIRGDEVVIQHIAVRPGEAGQAKKSGWECDGVSAYAARNITVENCSITWATDEGLSASGPRFGTGEKGQTLQEWRDGTSSGILFRRNIVAENLSNSTHSKGEHSKGTLIHDNVRFARIERSLYAHNMERNVLFKGGTLGEMHDNVIYNAGRRFAHYNLHEGEWGDHPKQDGYLTIVRNAFMPGPSTDPKAAAFMIGGEGDVYGMVLDNFLGDLQGKSLPRLGTFGSKKATFHERQVAPLGTAPSAQQIAATLAACGARPWDRDPIDARIVADVRNGTGKIIDSEQEVGGYPVRPESRAPFIEADWNLDTMERRQR
jgi:hypothetical protein